jgi:hypothetical protein
MHINLKYRGLIKPYDCLTNKLTTTACILPLASFDKDIRNVPFEIKVLWDTGATLTFIKPNLRDKLKLCMFKTDASADIAGLGGIFKADFSIASIILTENLKIDYCPVYVLDYPVNFDMVIGMNIINMGDFSICNTDMKTSFSFIVPPLPNRINFTDIADALNNQK